jgi:DNA-binding CsgD family transcriptional regulator
MIDSSTPASRGAKLSGREVEVLELVASGLTNLEVAARLGVGVHGVKFHLASIYRKLGVANRTEATGVYLRAAASAAGDVPPAGVAG